MEETPKGDGAVPNRPGQELLVTWLEGELTAMAQDEVLLCACSRATGVGTAAATTATATTAARVSHRMRQPQLHPERAWATN